MKKNYSPNFNDPRVVRKVEKAIAWSCACLNPHNEKTWGRDHINKRIGSTSDNLSGYLRNQLMITTDSRYNPLKKKGKAYVLNVRGVYKLRASIGKPIKTKRKIKHIAVDFLKKQYHKELESGNFVYKNQSNRYWNDIQQIRSPNRRALFIEYNYLYDYDIKSAAPTLIFEYAKNIGISKRLKIDIVREFVANPKRARHELANRINVDYDVAKRLITMAFSGSKFGLQNSIFKLVKNRISYYKLKKDRWYLQLKEEVKKIWKIIKEHRGVRRMNPRIKWSIYFELEQKVMDQIVNLFQSKNARMFIEHDGWRSDLFLTEQELTAHIKAKTKFTVQIDIVRYK